MALPIEPSTRYFRPASSDAELRVSNAHSAYSAIEKVSSVTNSETNELDAASRSMPAAATSRKATNSGPCSRRRDQP